MSIKLKLDGFDDLLDKIQKAGGNVDYVMKKCLRESADIMQLELKEQMQNANVDKSLIDAMPPPELEYGHTRLTARVGYRKGTYDPKNPSVGYKVVFMNYGTPHRKKHGKIRDVSDGGVIKLGFIGRAKRRAKPKIQRQQEKALRDDLKGLLQ